MPKALVPHPLFAVAVVLTTATVLSPPVHAQNVCGEPENNFIWWDGFSGTALDGDVRALIMFEGSIVAVGGFDAAGGRRHTEGVARWTGDNWAALGTTAPGGDIHAAVVYDGQLIVGGSFMSLPGVPGVSHLARWNGSNWAPLSLDDPDAFIYALAVYEDRLVVGGALDHVLTWDGTDWSTLGDSPDGTVHTVLVHGDDLVIGGKFENLGALPASRVARWDGSSWNSFGTGVDGPAYSLLADGDDLVVGGDFTAAGGQPALGVARWDGTWNAYGNGIDGFVQSLCIYQGTLYAGGGFYDPDPEAISFLAAWTGSDWVKVGNRPSCNVYDMMEVEGELLVGGCFPTIGEASAPHLAVWDGSDWDFTMSNFGNGLSWYAGSFEPYGDKLAVAGGFTHAGPELLNRVALWDGTTWHEMDGGMNSTVFALTTFENDLIAGGFFTQAGGNTANRVARWNGSSWSAVGTGGIGIVQDLVVHNGELYAASDAGASEELAIARFDGTDWQPLGSGIPADINLPSVHAMASYDGKLYAGGAFTTAGGVTAASVAAWDGSTWSALGAGLESYNSLGEPQEVWVEAMEVYEGKLFVAGDFTVAGGNEALNVASWDGAEWSSVGQGLISPVTDLYVFEDRLVAGGYFNTAEAGSSGSACRSRIAYWEGDAWKPMGTGVNGFVLGLGSWNGQLYVGGPFTRAGSTTSFGIARWATFNLLVPVRLLSFTAQRNHEGGATLEWDVTDVANHSGFHVHRETPTGDRERLTDNLLQGGPHYTFTDPDPPAGPTTYLLAEWSRTGEVDWVGKTTLAAAPVPALAMRLPQPNPFRDETRITYSLPTAGAVTITVFDVRGRAVASLFEAAQPAGPHAISWDGTDGSGRELARGIYFLRMTQNGNSLTRRVLLLP